MNQQRAPWQIPPVAVPHVSAAPPLWLRLLLVLMAAMGALAFLWAIVYSLSGSRPKPTAIPDRGQLIEAAAAYSANQADGSGLTVTRARILTERLLPDGRAVVKLEVWTEGGTQNHFVEWVVLKRHLWIGQSYRLCPVRVSRVCR